MMCMHTGKELTLEEHIKQSIGNILLTPKGSRVLNREFGSNIHNYLDIPINLVGVELGAEVFTSLKKWEPRVKAIEVTPKLTNSKGELVIDIKLQGMENTTVTIKKSN